MAYKRRGGDIGPGSPVTAQVAAPTASYVSSVIPTTTDILAGDGFGGVTTAAPTAYLDPASGLSATYTFGGGTTGDVATMEFTGGQLTAITTVP